MTQDWEKVFFDYCHKMENKLGDASHDIGHFMRVARTAQQIAAAEQNTPDSLVLLAAAYFHDIVCLPKNHPEAHLSSYLAADKAIKILTDLKFPELKLQAVHHAIHAHSFSANIEPQTCEAKIIQDADRLEALGALGILRVFYLAGRLGSQPYHKEDPLAQHRSLNDKSFALDHFYCKLFKLPHLLKTNGGRQLAEKRAAFLQQFVNEITQEISKTDGAAIWLVWTCHQGGQNNLRLFDTLDPFALHRKHQSECYVVDQLLEKETQFPFIHRFLEELNEEIVLI